MTIKTFLDGVMLALIVFVLMVIRQLIFSNQMNWIDIIGVSVAVILAYMFFEWAKKPYRYKKTK